MNLPKAKTDNVVVQQLKGELLVYNLTTHQAFQLNETSKIIFESCDGQTTFDELKRRHRLTNDLIHLALAELNSNDLLRNYQSEHFKGLSRREAIRRVGLASMVALPLVASIVAPSAANAASGRGTQANNTNCTRVAAGDSAECQSGNCVDSINGNRITTLRCCAVYGSANNPPGFSFFGIDQADCTSGAQRGFCCSGAATYAGNNTCTCL